MARDDRAHVLDPEVALEQRLAQVAERRRDRRRRCPAANAVPETVERRAQVEPTTSDHDERRDEHAAEQAFDGLVGARRRQRTLSRATDP